MWSRPSSPPSRAERQAGFTLMELLVTLGVAGIMLTSAVSLVSTQTRLARRHVNVLESDQATRSSLDAMTRDIRLAGACLPIDGEFIPLEGTDAAGGDTITIRTGLVANRACLVTATSVLARDGATSVTVGDATGFAAATLAYVRHLDGSGQILPVASADAGTATITFADTLERDYPVGTGVYAIDQRAYTVDRSDPAVPVLTLTVNDGDPVPFAVGVVDLQLNYVLARNCPPCDQVDLPLDAVEWRLVNSVLVTTTFEPVGATRMDDYTPPIVATASAKPRNLLP